MSYANPAPIVLESTEASEVSIQLTQTEHNLTEEQQQIVKVVYESAKQTTQSLFENKNIDTTLLITQLVAKIVKIVETVHINQKQISGTNKKAVALEVGRLLIHDHVKEEKVKQIIVAVYDAVAEQTLEVMIDVSHVVNTKVKEATSSLFKWICSCF